MAAATAAAGQGGASGDGTLAMTRLRSARINRLVDMIPARCYLNSDHQQVFQNLHKCLDPALIKTTSQLVIEAATMLGSETVTASSSGPGTSRNNSGKKRKLGGAGSSALSDSRMANSKEDLRSKLQERINELREERRRKQAENDKANGAAVKTGREKEGTVRGWRIIQTNGKSDHAASLTLPEEDIEIGRLNHAPSTADLPFSADVNRKGSKVRRRQEALRQEEANQRRLQQAESRGEDAQELRKELLMKKALKRAGGEKVHDDISKLRKAQKMHEVRKAKSQEKWKQRKEDLKTQQDDRQAQRKENLKKKAMNKKKNKGKRSGFEGKRSGYMNAE